MVPYSNVINYITPYKSQADTIYYNNAIQFNTKLDCNTMQYNGKFKYNITYNAIQYYEMQCNKYRNGTILYNII